ncbi:MAG: hypothetical protein R3E01_29625 [Pirellulaceae bacterium]|nr:hypothetical protein [Planctomycetales bacterium]
MITFFQLYQYVAPAVLLPLSYWLWSRRYGDWRMVLAALSIPILFAYIIPGIGTNVLHLWEFNTRFRLGRFRPQHGLIFGSATSLFAIASIPTVEDRTIVLMLRDGFVLGSVLAFWNWWYDRCAIQVGFIRVYTRKQYEQAGAAEVAADYAPILFGTFGFCYGASLAICESAMMQYGWWSAYWPMLISCQVACLSIPVLSYVSISYWRTGESGLRSFGRMIHET